MQKKLGGNMKEKIGYKAVYHNPEYKNGGYFSAIVYNTINEVEYYLNKPARPNYNQPPLYVFSSLKNCKEWMKDWEHNNVIIYKCLYTISNKRYCDNYDNDVENYVHFADSVTLLEDVK